ncbi:MAG: GNAT family N-acetyltransferase [Elainella sp. C42_A2020_010]|nr:GNAT family N-acetyltransferase [Elainella sp. C42_A2020_010]
MPVLTTRPYRGEVDLTLIVDLLNACEAVDREDNFYSATDLGLSFAEPDFDPTQNVRLWEDEAGRLIAYADLWTPPEPLESLDGFLWFRVLPTERWQGIERDILAWAEARVHQEATVHQLPAKLQLSCRDCQSDCIVFYQQHGYSYERRFLTMARSLTESIPEPILPEGFQIIQTRGVEDAAAWVEMYNQTFIDHWNFHPQTVAEHSYWLSTPVYCPELDLIAVAPDGTFAAFCHGHIDAEENQQKDRREGWINSLGTRRGFRRMGLARAILLAGLQRLKAAGMDTAKLGVDTQNPNSAQTLYESVGFQTRYASLSYSKTISSQTIS